MNVNPLTTRFLDSAIRERPDADALRSTYIWPKLFPMRPVTEYELTWDVIRSANHIAGVYSMTGTPIPGNDPTFYQQFANVLNMAASRKLDESTVMTLREPDELALKSRVLESKREKALRILRDKIAACDDEIDATIEYLCTKALLGNIVWPPVDENGNQISNPPSYWGNVSFQLDLGFRPEFKQNAATLVGLDSRPGAGKNWKDANADPILDLEVVRELMTETLHYPTWGSLAIMSSSVLSWISTREKVIERFAYTSIAEKFVDFKRFGDYLKNNLGLDILIYDAVWTYENIGAGEETEQHIRFIPRNKVIIVPPFAMREGNMFFATAPISGPNDEYKTGKQTWSTKLNTPPWSWEVGVQLKGFPIMKTSKDIFVLTVW